MKQKIQPIVQTVLIGTLVLALSLCSWFHTPVAFSESERRELAQFPELSLKTVMNGSFMTDFEEYTVDQFPLRDTFRALKALSATYLFRQLDNNGLYEANGYLSKIEYPLSASSIDNACDTFSLIYETHLKEKDIPVYLAVVPDKNAFLAAESGRPAMDYAAFYDAIRQGMPYASYVDITPLLTLEDYYKTDTHWRQEAIVDVADTLAAAMGTTLPSSYTENTLEKLFYGVYSGQAALPLPPDTLKYLTNDTINGLQVINRESDTPMDVYDQEKAFGRDPYEMFLSGSLSLISIENPHAATDKELVIFRDSFGSSITPLLAQGYKTVTVVDIRYISPRILDRFITFENQDVLFLYSTLVLNNNNTFMK